ncbi:hypothetical protein Trydic_g22163 [Trypoxylus dichotomus]
MSLLPLIFDDLYLTRPSRLLDQRFGMGLNEDDLLSPFTIPQDVRRLMSVPFLGYYRPWKSRAGQKDVGSEIALDKDKYQVNLDVQHFRPEEITVKITADNMITVEGKHEEKQDEHGYISRQFIRKYVLPKGHDVQNIQSKLSSDGVLTITVPKVDTAEVEYRTIPIEQTGIPSRPVENKLQNKKVEK